MKKLFRNQDEAAVFTIKRKEMMKNIPNEGELEGLQAFQQYNFRKLLESEKN